MRKTASDFRGRTRAGDWTCKDNSTRLEISEKFYICPQGSSLFEWLGKYSKGKNISKQVKKWGLEGQTSTPSWPWNQSLFMLTDFFMPFSGQVYITQRHLGKLRPAEVTLKINRGEKIVLLLLPLSLCISTPKLKRMFVERRKLLCQKND